MTNRGPTEFVVGEDGRVTLEPRRVRWQIVGAAPPAEPPQPPPEERERAELNLLLRDAGVLPEPVVSYSTTEDGTEQLHLDFPTASEHAEDAEYARLLCLSRIPLMGRRVPELDDDDSFDPAAEAALERFVHEELAIRALVARLAEQAAEMFHSRRPALRRARKRTPQPTEPTEPPVVAAAEPGLTELEKVGGAWRAVRPARLRGRARLRRRP